LFAEFDRTCIATGARCNMFCKQQYTKRFTKLCVTKFKRKVKLPLVSAVNAYGGQKVFIY
jgi:hypothetical protein